MTVQLRSGNGRAGRSALRRQNLVDPPERRGSAEFVLRFRRLAVLGFPAAHARGRRITLERKGRALVERFRGHLHGERDCRQTVRAPERRRVRTETCLERLGLLCSRCRARRRIGVAAGGATSSKFTANGADAGFDVQRRQVGLGGVRQTDPSLLGRTDSTPVNVMIKYDFDATASYTGGIAGLAATSPRVTGKSLKANAARGRAPTRATPTASRARSPRPSRRPCRAPRSATAFQTVYGGVAAHGAGELRSRDLLKVDGVVAVQQDTLEQPQSTTTPSSSARPPSGRRSAARPRRRERHRRRHRHRHLARASDALADHGLAGPPGGLTACQFGDGSDVAHLGPTFACNNKLDRRLRRSPTRTWPSRRRRRASSATTRRISARRATPTATARTPRRRPPATASRRADALRRRARPDQRHRPGRPRDHVPRLPRAGLLQLRLGRGGPAGDPRRRRRHQLLDLAAAPTRTPTRSSWRSSTRSTPGISVNASAGNSGPGAGDRRPRRPVGDDGRRLDRAARRSRSTLHLTADGGATFDMPGVDAHATASRADAGRARRRRIPGEDALCQTTRSPAGAATGKIVVCQRGANGRVDKGFNVLHGGAAGMILYNPTPSRTVETDNHWLPAIHLDGPATALLAFVSGHTGVTATWAQGTPTPTPGRRDGGVLVARPARRLHQARRHRARRPDPRRQDAARRRRPPTTARPATSTRRSPAPRCRARTRPASRRSSRRRIPTGRRR